MTEIHINSSPTKIKYGLKFKYIKINKMGKGKMIGVADPHDILKQQTAEIAKYWKERTGNVLSYTLQDIIRLLVNNYHQELLTSKPNIINLNKLFIIAK